MLPALGLDSGRFKRTLGAVPVMSTEYTRPFLSVLFYSLAALVLIAHLAVGISVILGGIISWPAGFEADAEILPVLGAVLLVVGVLSASFLVALGAGLDLLAKIEFNTRTSNQPVAVSASKRFFVKLAGEERGPLSAPEMVNLYREGKLTNVTPVFVEENGLRRQMTNWSEIGL